MLRRFRFSALAALVVAILLFATAYDTGVLQAHDPAHSDTHEAICAALITDTTQTSLRSDCEVLLDVKDTLRGTASLNWGDTGVAFASWDGITTGGTGASARVTRLQLRDLGLSGTIPARLGELTGLTWLLLDRNDLTGSIPSELGSLTRLDYLYLYDNQLSGEIPSALGNLSRLARLYLRTNQLSGEIPPELGNLSALFELSIRQNQLTGEIPSELGDLSSLGYLYLSHNKLSGTIPTSFGTDPRPSLYELYLDNNQLSGSIPDELGYLNPTTHIDLSHNQLSGPIPRSLLTYQEGRLEDRIPFLFQLRHLDLSHNQLSGPIPTDNGNVFNTLWYIDLSHNRLSGSFHRKLFGMVVGESWGSTELEHLDLSNNRLSGSLPDLTVGPAGVLGSFRLPVNLRVLYLHDNFLTGTLPDLRTNSPYLTELGLGGGNDFGLNWEMFESDGILGLDAIYGNNSPANPLTTNSPSFTDSSLRAARYPAQIPANSLLALYLHQSGLEGAIPDWVGAQSQLQTLWLQNNSLTGNIPANFSGLTSLVDLRLYGNMLTDESGVLDALPEGVLGAEPPPPGAVGFPSGAQPRVAFYTVSPDLVRLHLPPHPSISSVVRIVAAVDIEVFGNFTPPAVVCISVPDSTRQALEEDQELVLLHEFQDGVWRVLESSDPPSGYDPGSGNIAVCGMTDSFSLFGVAVVEYVPVGTGAIQRISRIEPSIRDVMVSQGDTIRLSFDIYGRQDILDNDLGEGHHFTWDDGGAGGSIRPTDRANEIIYTAPESPGTHTITVTSPTGACLGGENVDDRCTAKFTIKVRRPSAVQEERPAPKNPVGEIPSVLADAEGRQYEVFTPEQGGFFDGGDVTLSAEPGVIPNLEIVGVRVDAAGPASNVGITAHRYTLVGDRYDVLAVDAAETSISSYVLNAPLEVCVPLPPAARHDISNVAIVVTNPDGTQTVLSASVRITASSGVRVCGNLGILPASIAVGTAGSPGAIPTATPDPDEIEDPDTGGYAPLGSGLLMLMMIVGGVIVVTGVVGVLRRRSG